MSPRKAKTPSQSSGTKTTPKKVSSTRSQKKTSLKSSDTTRKSHSSKASTVNSLEKNLKKLTTTTKSTTKLTKRRSKNKEIKVINSRKLEMFPWVKTFPYHLKDETENKKCWFVCEEHATKYIRRYNCEYKLYFYTGTKG